MITVIVQARLGSKRLHNKMLLDLHGYKIIEWVLLRIKQSAKTEKFVLAIPDTSENDILEKFGNELGVDVFRGSENDVLSRFYFAAVKYDSSYIVRVCADNPLIAASEIDRLIEFYFNNKYEYAYNHIPKGNKYPDGLGAEMVSFDILKYLYINATELSQREHIFNFIWDNPSQFKIGTFDPKDTSMFHPEMKFDLDTDEDYKRLLRLPITPSTTALESVELFHSIFYSKKVEL